MPAPIVDAVTAILVHDGEIFMTRRHPALLAFPGYHAFPGGKVDPEDAQGPAFAHPLLAAHDATQMRALVRELREELGFDLAAAAARGEVLRLDAVGTALTPPTFPRRFSTYFFRVLLGRRPEFELDTREALFGAWAAPRSWMNEYLDGAMLVAPPTHACLAALVEDPAAERIGGLSAEPTLAERAVQESICGLRQIYVPSNTLPPAEHTNCFVIGDEGHPRIAVDPSPRNREELERLGAQLVGLGVTALFITHHHPDHRQFADAIARRYGWPLLMSADTAERIPRRGGAGFFEGVQLRLCQEGDAVTLWLGHPVRVLAVPGHDEGQLALMPDNGAWCIVGDLIQGIGTVVIAKPEGNMRRYFATLERVIALAPRAIFPSHGPGMGTTYRLEETLRHRRAREEQVLALHRAGHSIDQMLPALYSEVDPRLLPLARMNIESHLDKLREEGRLAA